MWNLANIIYKTAGICCDLLYIQRLYVQYIANIIPYKTPKKGDFKHSKYQHGKDINSVYVI